jgi:hypothetical protein
MTSTGIAPDPIIIRARNAQANAWLKSWNETASHLLLAVLEQDQMSIRDAASAARILCIEWRGATVVVSESLAPPASYHFVDMPTAIVFLNALLMRHVADLTEPPAANDYAFRPAFGAD